MADTTINGQPAISGLTVSFLGGFPAMVQIFGQLCGGPISNRFGRKKSMMIFSALFLLGSVLSITAKNWRWFLGAGCVTKLGLGIAQTTLIVYLAEIAPFQLRGAGMVIYQLFLAGGQLTGAIATQIQVSVDENKWRPLIASEFVITGVSTDGRVQTSSCLASSLSSCCPLSPNRTFSIFGTDPRLRRSRVCVACMTLLLNMMQSIVFLVACSSTLTNPGSRVSGCQRAD